MILNLSSSILARANEPRLRNKLDDILQHPGVHFVLVNLGSNLEISNEKTMASIPWWMDRLKETNPSLYNKVDLESGGRLGFGTVLVDMVALLREYL